MPGDHGELTGDRDDSHLAAAPGGDAPTEGAQRPGATQRRVGGLAERRARRRGALLGDVAGARRRTARLAYAWVEAEVTDQPAGRGEAAHIADYGDERGGAQQADTGDRHQPADLGRAQGEAGDGLLEACDLAV